MVILVRNYAEASGWVPDALGGAAAPLLAVGVIPAAYP